MTLSASFLPFTFSSIPLSHRNLWVFPKRTLQLTIAYSTQSSSSTTAISNNSATLNKKVLVPIAYGTEEMEAIVLVDVLRRAGAKVLLASVEPQLEVEASLGSKIVADTFISTCAQETFDLVALPGGMPGSARLRDCEILRTITKKQAEEKRLYGAICVAPAVALESWGLVKRKQVTAHPAFMHKLPSFRAVKSNIQVSGELTTGRGPGTSFEFALSFVEQLFGSPLAQEIGETMVVNDSHCEMEEFNKADWCLGNNPQVVIPIANGSEETEVVTIVDILRRAKINVVVASVEKSLQIKGSQNIRIIADMSIDDAAKSTYDLIILPGGSAGSERLHKSKVLKKMLKEQKVSSRIYGAISSSPTILQKQGLLKGKMFTAHPSVISMLTTQVASSGIIIDGNVITSKGLGATTQFSLAIVSKLIGHARARSVAEGIVFELPKL